ncbi:sepiapterin reductase-like isoform X2 [Syngnathus typhle]|uniref:sepiapterin reductase-like isoform X2 n=1 Tax=Syngnathus typhle TaxID=161592 RepID=UPI002A69DFAA|nr:sepiapterin reductase-like isoform X2 [Syngnathus typhle]
MEHLGRALCIITGASKGFGRALAKEMARVVKPGSVFVLVARSGDELQTLKTELVESELEVRCVVLDLSQMEAPERVVQTAKESFSPDIEHVILVNNAAALGDVSRFTKSFTSMAEPFSSWVLYCTGKAARDMMFKVLAEEEPDLRVLNYAPGPLDTDMQLVARTRTGEMSLRKAFADMFDESQLLTCETSCAKLMKLLLEDKYKSGDHIDFYDM